MKCLNICVVFIVGLSFLISRAALAQNASNFPARNNNMKILHSDYKPWARIAMKDVAKRRRVWEDIDITENNNSKFGVHNTGIALVDAMINGVKDDNIITYSNVNDRFTTSQKPEEFSAISEDIISKHTHITKFVIKEDSLYLNTGEVTVRILGIPPVGYAIGPDGAVKEQPLFWIFYPDWREYLSQYIASGSYSWDDIFERRIFTGKVTKVTKVSEHAIAPLGKK